MFTPHYITTLGPRPTWLSAPASMQYNSTIDVAFYANGVKLGKVVLVENGHSTHSINSGYRHVVLGFALISTVGSDATAITTCRISAPSNTFVSSPGALRFHRPVWGWPSIAAAADPCSAKH